VSALLLDVSGSMADQVGRRRAIDVLAETLAVLTDGLPDDPSATLAPARALRCEISAVFCGNGTGGLARPPFAEPIHPPPAPDLPARQRRLPRACGKATTHQGNVHG
jgi:hypothetical protein